MTPSELIDALDRGREIRPVRINGRLFKDQDKACALGAIAVGLGYTDIDASENRAYLFLLDYTGSHSFEIYRENDNSFNRDGSYFRDPDEAVKNWLRSLPENFDLTQGKRL